MADINLIAEALQAGDKDRTRTLTAHAVQEGTPTYDLLTKGAIAGLNAVGQNFQEGYKDAAYIRKTGISLFNLMIVLKPRIMFRDPEIVKTVINEVKQGLHPGLGGRLALNYWDVRGVEAMQMSLDEFMQIYFSAFRDEFQVSFLTPQNGKNQAAS